MMLLNTNGAIGSESAFPVVEESVVAPPATWRRPTSDRLQGWFVMDVERLFDFTTSSSVSSQMWVVVYL